MAKKLKRTDTDMLLNREYKIIKSNILIQKTRYSLNLQEQKIILYLTSKIKPTDTGREEYIFSIREFCRLLGINYSGKNYKILKETIKNLSDKSFWKKLDNGSETLLRWIERPTIDVGSGVVRIKLDELMMPFLIDLKDFFTEYNLYFILAMKSQYGVRLYELLKSYQNMKIRTFDLDYLKSILYAEKYKRFPDFRRYVLEPALRDIKECSDIDIDYELQKIGKAYKTITFSIKQKKNLINVIEHTQHELGDFAPWENRPKK